MLWRFQSDRANSIAPLSIMTTKRQRDLRSEVGGNVRVKMHRPAHRRIHQGHTRIDGPDRLSPWQQQEPVARRQNLEQGKTREADRIS